jgi:hypothetical protein
LTPHLHLHQLCDFEILKDTLSLIFYVFKLLYLRRRELAFFRFLIFDGGWPYHRVFFLSES